jgi:transposase
MSERRRFTREFKVEAVALITQQRLSVGEVSRRLGVGQGLLRKWRTQLTGGATHGKAEPEPGPAAAVEAELRRLRAENERLRMEREILKKATAFFARESR